MATRTHSTPGRPTPGERSKPGSEANDAAARNNASRSRDNSGANAPRAQPSENRSSRTSDSQIELRQPAPDAIAAKAYELWLERGGDADANWYEAEQILQRENRRE